MAALRNAAFLTLDAVLSSLQARAGRAARAGGLRWSLLVVLASTAQKRDAGRAHARVMPAERLSLGACTLGRMAAHALCWSPARSWGACLACVPSKAGAGQSLHERSAQAPHAWHRHAPAGGTGPALTAAACLHFACEGDRGLFCRVAEDMCMSSRWTRGWTRWMSCWARRRPRSRPHCYRAWRATPPRTGRARQVGACFGRAGEGSGPCLYSSRCLLSGGRPGAPASQPCMAQVQPCWRAWRACNPAATGRRLYAA